MATTKIRKTLGRNEMDRHWQFLASLALLVGFSTISPVAIGNGGTAGNLRTNATANFTIAGVGYSKASTDDLWNLAAETDTAADKYRAYWLYLDSSGTASFAAGADSDSAAAALAALPTPDSAKSIIGVYVAGAATDFNAGGGLAAQGTIYNGPAPGARLPGSYSDDGGGNSYARYVRPAVIELVEG